MRKKLRMLLVGFVGYLLVAAPFSCDIPGAKDDTAALRRYIKTQQVVPVFDGV